MVHHHPPNSTLCIRVHSWCCVFCGCGQIFSHMSPSCRVEFHSSNNPTFVLYLFNLFLSNSWKPLIFLLFPTVSLFPTCHIVGIRHYVTFSGRLLSLSNMHERFFYVFHGLIAYFFLVLNNIPFSGFSTDYLPIHLLKDMLVASSFANYK